jgi:probable addiction module antidote protein
MTQAKTITTPYDTVEYLKTEEDMALYFEACLEEAGDDSAFIAKALGDIARARGMTQLARDTGLGREGLYKALSTEGNPSFATILKVINALGLRLHAGVAHS